jgi:hypothetical protein
MSLSTPTEKVKANYQTAKTTAELSKVLAAGGNRRLLLDCGHFCTIGHNFANTVIVYSLGGGRISTSCHNCGY